MNALVTNPLVSIVIPVYNRELYIEDAIRSAISQTYQNIEIIIVDNCSTDSTWDILNEWEKKDNRIKIFQNDSNIGPVLNWNECFRHASGEYIKILWSDDWISHKFVEKCLSVFEKNTAFVLSGYQIVAKKMVLSEVVFKKNIYSVLEYLNNILLYNREGFPVSPGCAMFRTKDILAGFIVNIPNDDGLDSKKNGAGNDLLLFLNTVVNYTSISTISGVDSYFRSHEESFSVANQLDLYYEWAKVFFIRKYLYGEILENSKKIQLIKRRFTNSKYKSIIRNLSFNKYIFKGILLFIRCRLL